MPELPEVETTVRGLARYLEGARIVRVAVNRPDLRRPFPPDLVQVLTGARVTTLARRAKYGLIHTDRGQTMIFHLGMSGRWRIEPDRPEKHDHLVIETGAGHILALNDARRFGSVDLVDTDKLDAFPSFAALGPEPLGDGLSAAHLIQAFAGRIAPVKPLLLDQRVVAGSRQYLRLRGAPPRRHQAGQASRARAPQGDRSPRPGNQGCARRIDRSRRLDDPRLRPA